MEATAQAISTQTEFVILNDRVIVQNKPPYYTGRLIYCNTDIEYAEKGSLRTPLWVCGVTGYRILVRLERSLEGKAHVDGPMYRQVREITQGMAEAFYEEVIRKDPDRFRKYLF